MWRLHVKQLVTACRVSRGFTRWHSRRCVASRMWKYEILEKMWKYEIRRDHEPQAACRKPSLKLLLRALTLRPARIAETRKKGMMSMMQSQFLFEINQIYSSTKSRVLLSEVSKLYISSKLKHIFVAHEMLYVELLLTIDGQLNKKIIHYLNTLWSFIIHNICTITVH